MKKVRFFLVMLCLLLLFQTGVVPVFATEGGDTAADTTTATDVTDATDAGPAIPPEGEIPVVTGEDASVSNGCHTMDALISLGGSEKKVETAKSAILYELNSGTLLYAYQPNEKVYPASLVKIMTALLAVEDDHLEQTVTVTETALATVPYDALTVQLKAGETLTMKDLLYCMMVESANDACTVIAEQLAGSQEAFVARMNTRAKELGCTGTQFVNAHGLPDEQQYTTARDIGKIVETALQYDAFREVFGAVSYTVPETNCSQARYLVTTNYFMSTDRGVVKFRDSRFTGGKSGAISNTTDRSIACTAESGDLNLLCIVMGAEGTLEEDGYSLKRLGNFEEAAELMNYGFQNFMVSQILYEGKSVTQFPVTNGENQIVSRPVETVYSALPFGTTAEHLTWRYLRPNGELTAPVEKDDPVGTVQVWFGAVCLAQSDMVSMNGSVVYDKLPGTETLTGDTGNGGQFLKILGIVFIVLLGLAVVYLGVKFIRAAIIRARRRRRRKNRRRSR